MATNATTTAATTEGTTASNENLATVAGRTMATMRRRRQVRLLVTDPLVLRGRPSASGRLAGEVCIVGGELDGPRHLLAVILGQGRGAAASRGGPMGLCLERAAAARPWTATAAVLMSGIHQHRRLG